MRATRHRGTTTQRGYTSDHRALRRQWQTAVDNGMAVCSRCGNRIEPGQPWDLDHDDNRTTYRGPSCASCNRAAGARNAARKTNTARAFTVRGWDS
jgi:Recombination endonuclease VII